ncbi:9584_t:CDS:1 [Ambispora leptoticha]|uniref:9584_t:CDS:1 n=1 Tax=Ambispora leptoticha TaxID=144679 RepID=A0A9N9GDQ9_9GLOM|nr:9584_t:CDS:1 [Ambispora leptoticha]
MAQFEFPQLPHINDPNLENNALTHPSINRHNNINDNPCITFHRLRFLGHFSFLMQLTNDIFHRYPTHNARQLQKLVDTISARSQLAEFALGTQLDSKICASITPEKVRANQRILSDCFLAYIGAMYLDIRETRKGGMCDEGGEIGLFVKGLVDCWLWQRISFSPVVTIISNQINSYHANGNDNEIKFGIMNTQHINENAHEDDEGSESTVSSNETRNHAVYATIRHIFSDISSVETSLNGDSSEDGTNGDTTLIQNDHLLRISNQYWRR